MAKKPDFNYRSSVDGKYISKKEAEKTNPDTWEKERRPNK